MITASGPAGTASRKTRLHARLAISADGTYAIPADQAPCSTLATPVLIHGNWHANRAGRLMLAPVNQRDFANALRDCDGRIANARLARFRSLVRVGRTCRGGVSPNRLCGRETARYKLRVLGQAVTLTIDQHYSGTRLDAGEYTPRLSTARERRTLALPHSETQARRRAFTSRPNAR